MSLARYRQAQAMSSGSPMRPSGMDSMSGLMTESGSASTMSVWVTPGATAFTRILCLASSRASDSVSPFTANLLVG